jgi:hypothetical protein
MSATKYRVVLMLAAAFVVAACDQSPKPPSAPPVPKTESGSSGESQTIFRTERKALERAKGVAPAAEEHERDMRERVERESR